MVYYRTYRPQTIEQLDSTSVRDTLSAVLAQKSIAHAFLFTGPKGLGKTSTARIIAKILNCERKSKSKDIEPCNKCDQCISITNGTNMDVLEIDGASNRGIDEMRDLREKIRLSPLSSNKKVYIIDEVHMLTTESFNALLKTLEEPPSHAVFILCTTEPQKVPATIQSRCFHIEFHLPTEEEMLNSLSRIVKGEKITIDKEALSSIALLSEGSFRDGAKILEHVVALSENKKITKTLIDQLYKIGSVEKNIKEITEAFAAKDTKRALSIIGQLAIVGVDMKYFMEQLISVLHELLLIKVGVNPSTSFGQTQDKSLRAGSLPLTIEELKSLIELLAKAHGELKYAVLPQLPLELMVIEWGQQDESGIKNQESGKEKSYDSQFIIHDSKPQVQKKPSQNNDIFQELITRVKQENYSIAGVLRSCKLQEFNDKMLVIEAGYKFHKDKLGEQKTITLLEKIAQEITGKNVKVEVVLKSA